MVASRPNSGSVIVAILLLGLACDRKDAPSTVYKTSSHKVPPSDVSPLKERPPPTPTSEEFPAAGLAVPSARYRVFNVLPDQQLPLREAAKETSEEVGLLDPTDTNVRLTGAWARAEQILFVQVRTENELAWTDRGHLIEVPPGDACSDAHIDPILERFIEAVQNEDGRALAKLTAASRGLLFRSYLSDETIHIPQSEVAELFDENRARDWRMYPDSARASFRRVVLPELQDTYASGYLRNCNEPGLEIPPELGGLTLVTSRLNTGRSTWVLGFEYLGEQPHVALLFHGK